MLPKCIVIVNKNVCKRGVVESGYNKKYMVMVWLYIVFIFSYRDKQTYIRQLRTYLMIRHFFRHMTHLAIQILDRFSHAVAIAEEAEVIKTP